MTVAESIETWCLRYGVERILEVGGQSTGPCEARGIRVERARELTPIMTRTDMVVVHTDGADPAGRALRHEGWAGQLRLAKQLAEKFVVVVAANDDSLFSRARGARKEDLIPVLWELGRVRDRVFVGVPPLVERGIPSAPRVSKALVRRLARAQVFLLDVRPRSPQARRKQLRMLA